MLGLISFLLLFGSIHGGGGGAGRRGKGPQKFEFPAKTAGPEAEIALTEVNLGEGVGRPKNMRKGKKRKCGICNCIKIKV